MKFAYADPPYLRMGKKMYSKYHSDAEKWDDPNSHKELIDKLVLDYSDGWALSCNPKDLSILLPFCPEDIRICIWTKTFHQIRPTTIQYAYECVLLYKGRKENKRKPMIRDWLASSIAMKKGLQGSKPDVFNKWILDLLNVKEEDEVHDLFSGTKGLEEVAKTLNLKVISHKETI